MIAASAVIVTTIVMIVIACLNLVVQFLVWCQEKKENDIYAYFGMPLIDPYSDSYILKQIEELYKQGGASMMSLDEYYNHKEHYEKYAEHGCTIDIEKEFVKISYDRNSQK